MKKLLRMIAPELRQAGKTFVAETVKGFKARREARR